MDELEGYLKDLRIDEIPNYGQEADMSEKNKLYAQRANGEKIRLYRSNEKMEMPEPKEDLSIGRMVRGLYTGNWNGAEAESRVLGSSPASAGGVLVPEAISARVIEAARNATRVIQAGALTYPMASSSEVIAQVTSNATPYFTPESEEILESDLIFQPFTLTAYKLGAIVRLPQELLEDASNIDQIIKDSLSGAMSRAIDYACLSGSGSGEPLGILNSGDVGSTDITSPAANEIMGHMLDGIFDMADQNLEPSELSCLMNSTFGKTLAKAVDGTGAYVSGNAPAEYSAMKRYITNQIADDGDISPVVFGRFSDYILGIRKDLTIEVSKEEGDSFKKHLVAIKITWRGDGAPSIPANFGVYNFDLS